MKKPWYLMNVMLSAGMLVYVVSLFFAKLQEVSQFWNFWLVFVIASLVNSLILAIFSIFIYREGVRFGSGRLLHPFFLRHGKKFQIAKSFFDEATGNTYVELFVGVNLKICRVPYRLPKEATHLMVVEAGVSSVFHPVSVTPEVTKTLKF